MKIETLGTMNNTANSIMNIALDFSLGINYELLESDIGIKADMDDEKELKPNNGDLTIPVTGGIVGSLDKMGIGRGMLLFGGLIVNKPRKKGEKSND